MEGRASTFKKVLSDFESRIQSALFVAIDTELTGVDLEGEPDTFAETAEERLEKLMRIAERYTLIQLGLTIVSRKKDGGEGQYVCASYNLFAFPYVGPEINGKEPGFFCQASALQFNAHHGVNFNLWISEGISYMSREEEKQLSRTHANNGTTNHVDEKVGLLRLWRSLCAARVPFVVHGPLDLFFLLAAFEKKPLPRQEPRALALLIRQCTPKVYDTAHLHGQIGRFKRLGLLNYFEDVQATYEEIRMNARHAVPRVGFELIGDTAGRYSKFSGELAHEAGFDSLVTAQLFAYLRVIAPVQVKEAANKLFLFRSVDYLDLEKSVVDGKIAQSMYDQTRVTLLVAALDPVEGIDSPRHIGSAGFTCKWMDSKHALVILRASGGAAVRKAAELAAKVPGVVSWMPFEQWRQNALQAQAAKNGTDASSAPSAAAAPEATSKENQMITGSCASTSSRNAAGKAGCFGRASGDDNRTARVSGSDSVARCSARGGDGQSEQSNNCSCEINPLVSVGYCGNHANRLFRLLFAGGAAALLLVLVARHRKDGCRVPLPFVASGPILRRCSG